MNDTLAGASPVDQPVRLDPERLAFEDWADERWGREAYRHKSDTSGEWDAWQAALAAQAAEVEVLRADYQNACKLVADMHRAAMGQTVGPVLGVVEDVEALRADAERLQKAWDASFAQAMANGERSISQAAELQSLRDAIANDSLACTYQTLGQYRTMLLAAIDSLLRKD